MAQEESDAEDEKSSRIRHAWEGGLTLGGQLSNEAFVYKSGMHVQYTAYRVFSSRVMYGLGVGFEQFDQERFIPIFASFQGLLKKKDNSPFLTAQLGYAIGINRNYPQYEGYHFRGGILFSPGIGYKFSIGDRFAALAGIHYKHQFAKQAYETAGSHTYRTTLNYDLIAFRAGILF